VNCTHCGTTTQAGADFCGTCGKPLGAAPPQPASAAAPPAAHGTVHMRLQGVDRSWRANGSYDEIDCGQVDRNYVVQVVRGLLPQSPPEGDDICPIAVFLEGAGGLYESTIEAGSMALLDTFEEVTPEMAFDLAAGNVAAPAASSPPAVRRSDVAPTNVRAVTTETLDRGPNTPQFTLRVTDGESLSSSLLPFMWLPTLVCLMVLAGAAAEGDGGIACPALFGLVALGVVWFLAAKNAKHLVTMGIDWKANSLWVERADAVHMVPNANAIQSIQANEEQVVVVMSDGETEVSGTLLFAKSKEAQLVAQHATQLLSSGG